MITGIIAKGIIRTNGSPYDEAMRVISRKTAITITIKKVFLFTSRISFLKWERKRKSTRKDDETMMPAPVSSIAVSLLSGGQAAVTMNIPAINMTRLIICLREKRLFAVSVAMTVNLDR